jgi:hypothetical protein
VCHQLLPRAVGDPQLARAGARSVGVEHEQRHVVGATVANADRLSDERVGRRELLLAVGRRHVLAGGVDDELLLAIDDPDVAGVVNLGDVAAVQPPVIVKHLRGAHRVGTIAVHDDRAVDEQLAVVGQAQLNAGNRPPDAAHLRRARGTDGDDARALRHPVDLGHG